MGTQFSRDIDGKIIANLKASDLWKNKLEDDCRKGKVFLAIRPGYISFYHDGGNLFKYDNQFSTDIKHAAIFTKVNKDDEIKIKDGYVTERQLQSGKIKLIDNFFDYYEQIKKNCSPYAKDEEAGLSFLYQRYSYCSNSNVVVLDNQVNFSYEDEDEEKYKHDRIDLLLFNKKTKRLRFIEAKLAQNPEIVADIASGGKPKVINQLARYRKQIKENHDDILKAYEEYVKTVNKIFDGLNLPIPERIDKKVGLLIFDYNDREKKEILVKHIIGNQRYNDIPVCHKSDIGKTDTDALWEETGN